MTVLLAIIYAAFISLGLPDAVVGAAWPSMHTELGADSAAAALATIVVVLSMPLWMPSWRPAYVTIGILQALLFVVFLGSRGLWAEHSDGESPSAVVDDAELPNVPTGANLTSKPWFKMPNLAIILVGFFSYSAVEMTLDLWGATYFVSRFGREEDSAATGGAAFYIGITAGRVAAGVAASRLSNYELLRAGAGVLVLGAVALFVPVPAVSVAGFAVAIALSAVVIEKRLVHTSDREQNSI